MRRGAASVYEWNGQAFRSLSAVARAITGVSWNGPQFFGVNRGLKSGGDSSAGRA